MCVTCHDIEIPSASTPQEPKGSKKRKRLTDKEEEKKETPNMRWLKAKELTSAAVPKGMKNCFELFVQWTKKTPKEKLKAHQAVSPKKQKKLEAFFLKQ